MQYVVIVLQVGLLDPPSFPCLSDLLVTILSLLQGIEWG